jgi:hypothetical protein
MIIENSLLHSSDKRVRHGSRVTDTSMEYTTAGERIWNQKSKEYFKNGGNQSDMKIKITEIEVRNVNPVELSVSELADHSMDKTKELVETIRRGSNKDLHSLCNQTNKVTPGKKGEMRRRLFDSSHKELEFSNSFGETSKNAIVKEKLDQSKFKISDNSTCPSLAFAVKKEPSQTSASNGTLKGKSSTSVYMESKMSENSNPQNKISQF